MLQGILFSFVGNGWNWLRNLGVEGNKGVFFQLIFIRAVEYNQSMIVLILLYSCCHKTSYFIQDS